MTPVTKTGKTTAPAKKKQKARGAKAPARRKQGTVVEDPRLSARRKSVVRSKLRRRLWVAAALLAVGLVGFGGWVVLHQSWFSANTITVKGAVHESRAEVISAAGLSAHPPLISINTGSAAAGVESLPWVKTATVSLKWPSTVTIGVVDRTPVGAVRDGSQWLIVDGTGRILTRATTRPPGTVVLQVAVPANAQPGHWLNGAAQGAMSVAASLPPAFKGQVASVIANKDGTVSLQLTAPVRVDLGRPVELTTKYQDIASVIAGATLHPGDVLDVSVPQASTITGP